MRAHLQRIIWMVLIVAAAALGVWYLTRAEPIKVVLKRVDLGRVESTVANTRAGTVKACRRAGLAPATGGQIASLPVHEGDQVRTGQILMELWNADRAAELTLAERDAVATNARADEACVTAGVAEREAQRMSELRRKGLASDETADRAVGDAKARRAGCQAAKAVTQVGIARVDVARAALERTLLRAPFDGIVAEVNGELGEFATPSPVGIPTPPAVDLIDRSCVYVSAPIDEVDAPQIRTGMAARISLDAFPGRQFPGSVRRIAPYVLDREKQARTVDVEVDFADAKAIENLLPGYSADVEVVLAVRENVLRLATEAVLEGPKVLVYPPEVGRLEERPIRIGVSNWAYTEILDGLTAGEQVVTSVDREGVQAGADVVPEAKAAGSRGHD